MPDEDQNKDNAAKQQAAADPNEGKGDETAKAADRVTSAAGPDDAFERCRTIIDGMQGSDHMRRQVAQRLMEHVNGG